MSLQVVKIHFGKEKYHLQGPMYDWCQTNIGLGGWFREPGHVWNMSSAFGNTFFEFDNPKDATAFLLVWN
jgi:hypothetical protein